MGTKGIVFFYYNLVQYFIKIHPLIYFFPITPLKHELLHTLMLYLETQGVVYVQILDQTIKKVLAEELNKHENSLSLQRIVLFCILSKKSSLLNQKLRH